jgi:predicted nucleic acid-binding protein
MTHRQIRARILLTWKGSGVTEPVLIDTGPLVAMLSSKDSANEACRECFSMLRRPPITTWPVLAEAAYLLRNTSNGVAALFGLFRVGAVQLRPLPEESLEWIEGFMKRYSSVGAQLADVAGGATE